MRTNLTSHDVKTYRYSCKYVITYHRVSDGLLSLRVTMWIEGLSLSVINRREKLATRLCVFCKTKNICLFIYFEKCTLKNTHVLLLCTKISLFLISPPSPTTSTILIDTGNQDPTVHLTQIFWIAVAPPIFVANNK